MGQIESYTATNEIISVNYEQERKGKEGGHRRTPTVGFRHLVETCE